MTMLPATTHRIIRNLRQLHSEISEVIGTIHENIDHGRADLLVSLPELREVMIELMEDRLQQVQLLANELGNHSLVREVRQGHAQLEYDAHDADMLIDLYTMDTDRVEGWDTVPTQAGVTETPAYQAGPEAPAYQAGPEAPACQAGPETPAYQAGTVDTLQPIMHHMHQDSCSKPRQFLGFFTTKQLLNSAVTTVPANTSSLSALENDRIIPVSHDTTNPSPLGPVATRTMLDTAHRGEPAIAKGHDSVATNIQGNDSVATSIQGHDSVATITEGHSPEQATTEAIVPITAVEQSPANTPRLIKVNVISSGLNDAANSLPLGPLTGTPMATAEVISNTVVSTATEDVQPQDDTAVQPPSAATQSPGDTVAHMSAIETMADQSPDDIMPRQSEARAQTLQLHMHMVATEDNQPSASQADNTEASKSETSRSLQSSMASQIVSNQSADKQIPLNQSAADQFLTHPGSVTKLLTYLVIAAATIALVSTANKQEPIHNCMSATPEGWHQLPADQQAARVAMGMPWSRSIDQPAVKATDHYKVWLMDRIKFEAVFLIEKHTAAIRQVNTVSVHKNVRVTVEQEQASTMATAPAAQAGIGTDIPAPPSPVSHPRTVTMASKVMADTPSTKAVSVIESPRTSLILQVRDVSYDLLDTAKHSPLGSATVDAHTKPHESTDRQAIKSWTTLNRYAVWPQLPASHAEWTFLPGSQQQDSQAVNHQTTQATDYAVATVGQFHDTTHEKSLSLGPHSPWSSPHSPKSQGLAQSTDYVVATEVATQPTAIIYKPRPLNYSATGIGNELHIVEATAPQIHDDVAPTSLGHHDMTSNRLDSNNVANTSLSHHDAARPSPGSQVPTTMSNVIGLLLHFSHIHLQRTPVVRLLWEQHCLLCICNCSIAYLPPSNEHSLNRLPVQPGPLHDRKDQLNHGPPLHQPQEAEGEEDQHKTEQSSMVVDMSSTIRDNMHQGPERHKVNQIQITVGTLTLVGGMLQLRIAPYCNVQISLVDQDGPSNDGHVLQPDPHCTLGQQPHGQVHSHSVHHDPHCPALRLRKTGKLMSDCDKVKRVYLNILVPALLSSPEVADPVHQTEWQAGLHHLQDRAVQGLLHVTEECHTVHYHPCQPRDGRDTHLHHNHSSSGRLQQLLPAHAHHHQRQGYTEVRLLGVLQTMDIALGNFRYYLLMINRVGQRFLYAKYEQVIQHYQHQQPSRLKTPNIVSFAYIHRTPHSPRISDVTKFAPPVTEVGTMSQLNEKRRHYQSDQTAHHLTQVVETTTNCPLVQFTIRVSSGPVHTLQSSYTLIGVYTCSKLVTSHTVRTQLYHTFQNVLGLDIEDHLPQDTGVVVHHGHLILQVLQSVNQDQGHFIDEEQQPHSHHQLLGVLNQGQEVSDHLLHDQHWHHGHLLWQGHCRDQHLSRDPGDLCAGHPLRPVSQFQRVQNGHHQALQQVQRHTGRPPQPQSRGAVRQEDHSFQLPQGGQQRNKQATESEQLQEEHIQKEAEKHSLHPQSCVKVSPVNKIISDTGQDMFSSYLGETSLHHLCPSKHESRHHPPDTQQIEPSCSKPGVHVPHKQEADVSNHLPVPPPHYHLQQPGPLHDDEDCHHHGPPPHQTQAADGVCVEYQQKTDHMHRGPEKHKSFKFPISEEVPTLVGNMETKGGGKSDNPVRGEKPDHITTQDTASKYEWDAGDKEYFTVICMTQPLVPKLVFRNNVRWTNLPTLTTDNSHDVQHQLLPQDQCCPVRMVPLRHKDSQHYLGLLRQGQHQPHLRHSHDYNKARSVGLEESDTVNNVGGSYLEMRDHSNTWPRVIYTSDRMVPTMWLSDDYPTNNSHEADKCHVIRMHLATSMWPITTCTSVPCLKDQMFKDANTEILQFYIPASTIPKILGSDQELYRAGNLQKGHHHDGQPHNVWVLLHDTLDMTTKSHWLSVLKQKMSCTSLQLSTQLPARPDKPDSSTAFFGVSHPTCQQLDIKNSLPRNRNKDSSLVNYKTSRRVQMKLHLHHHGHKGSDEFSTSGSPSSSGSSSSPAYTSGSGLGTSCASSPSSCTTCQSIRDKVNPHSPAKSVVPLITAAAATSTASSLIHLTDHSKSQSNQNTTSNWPLVTLGTGNGTWSLLYTVVHRARPDPGGISSLQVYPVVPQLIGHAYGLQHQQSLAQHQGHVQPLRPQDDDYPRKTGRHSPHLIFHQQHQVLDHRHGQGLFSPSDRSHQHFAVTYLHHHVHSLSHPALLPSPLQEHLLVEELPLLRVQQPMALLPLHGLPATHHNKAKASGMMTSCPHSSVVAEIMGQTSESETISKVKPVSHLRHDTAAYLPEVLAKEVEDIAIVPVPLLQDYIQQRRKPAQLLDVQRHWWQSAATTAQLLNQNYFKFSGTSTSGGEQFLSGETLTNESHTSVFSTVVTTLHIINILMGRGLLVIHYPLQGAKRVDMQLNHIVVQADLGAMKSNPDQPLQQQGHGCVCLGTVYLDHHLLPQVQCPLDSQHHEKHHVLRAEVRLPNHHHHPQMGDHFSVEMNPLLSPTDHPSIELGYNQGKHLTDHLLQQHALHGHLQFLHPVRGQSNQPHQQPVQHVFLHDLLQGGHHHHTHDHTHPGHLDGYVLAPTRHLQQLTDPFTRHLSMIVRCKDGQFMVEHHLHPADNNIKVKVKLYIAHDTAHLFARPTCTSPLGCSSLMTRDMSSPTLLMMSTQTDLPVLDPVHHIPGVASAILILPHDQLVLEQLTNQLPVPPKGRNPPGQHPDGLNHAQPLVDVLALAGTMVHHHHDVPQMVYLHALLHVRLPQQHLPLHRGLQGKSIILVLKLGHKFDFQRGFGPHQERRVHGGQHCHHHRSASHHHRYRARLPFHRTRVKLGHIHRVTILAVGMLPPTATQLVVFTL